MTDDPTPSPLRTRPGPLAGIWSAVTPFGRAVALSGLVAWLVAARTGWVELAVLGAAALLALAASAVFLLAERADLAVRLELATPRVVVGNTAVSRVVAVNEGARRVLPVRLEARVGLGAFHVQVPALAAGASFDELVVIPTSRRAVVPVGPVRSVQGDPLGLIRREVAWTGTELLHVHPRTVPVPALTTGWRRDLEGTATNDRSQSDLAFHTLREYAHGDDRRHIHWRTTARRADGRMMVREFVDTRRAQLGLLLSLRRADFATADEFELAVSVVASLGLQAIAEEQEVACLAGGRIVPSYRPASFLDALTAVDPGGDEDPALMAVRARDVVGGASVVVLVAGSTIDAASLRRTADRLGPSVQSLTVRANPGGASTLRSAGGRRIVDLGSLDELPLLVRTLVAA
jgi:uncharacterized protein (DUF58 family)